MDIKKFIREKKLVDTNLIKSIADYYHKMNREMDSIKYSLKENYKNLFIDELFLSIRKMYNIHSRSIFIKSIIDLTPETAQKFMELEIELKNFFDYELENMIRYSDPDLTK